MFNPHIRGMFSCYSIELKLCTDFFLIMWNNFGGGAIKDIQKSKTNVTLNKHIKKKN